MKPSIREKFIKAAEKAVAGLDTSAVMVGICGEGKERWEFMVQIGYCLMHNKPLILLVPTTMEVPTKLRAAATVVETYRSNDAASVQQATDRALKKLGIEAVH